jgi:hypothetical protein
MKAYESLQERVASSKNFKVDFTLKKNQLKGEIKVQLKG